MKNIGWDWGLLGHQPFLPRVRFDKFIFSKARWLLEKKEIKNLTGKTDGDLLAEFKNIKTKKKLPRYVLLSQGDNELMLDLENLFCIRLLLSEANKTDIIALTETLDLPGQCWIHSPEGRFTGELIMTFNRVKKMEGSITDNKS